MGAVFSLLIALPFADERFVGQIITNFGLSGLICGATVGIVLGALHDDKLIIALGGMIGGLVGPFLLLIGVWVYSVIPWPSPRPYPGTKMETQWGGGSSIRSRSRTYAVALSLDEIQRYYEKQMKWYCQGDWRFRALPDCEGYSLCREAECEIRRLWQEQYCRVTLYSVSETETSVYHVDFWED